MKRIFYLVIVLPLFGCQKSQKDKIVVSISKVYDIGTPDTLGDGTIMYMFDIVNSKSNPNPFNDPLKADVKIKGMIDKSLNSLPLEEKTDKYSEWEGCIANMYEWETIETKVRMENYFKHKGDSLDYLMCKIWITSK